MVLKSSMGEPRLGKDVYSFLGRKQTSRRSMPKQGGKNHNLHGEEASNLEDLNGRT
jgi:hypothetical protein